MLYRDGNQKPLIPNSAHTFFNLTPKEAKLIFKYKIRELMLSQVTDGTTGSGTDVWVAPRVLVKADFDAAVAELDKIHEPTATGGVEWNPHYLIKVGSDTAFIDNIPASTLNYVLYGLDYNTALRMVTAEYQSHLPYLFANKQTGGLIPHE